MSDAVALTRVRGPLLPVALVAVAGGLLAAVALGRPEPAALAAPFAVALAVGLAAPPPGRVRVELTPEADRIVEGDVLRASIAVTGAEPLGRVDLACEAGPGSARRWATGPGDGSAERRQALEVPTGRWGNVTVGPVWVRVRGPFDVVRWEGTGPRAVVRVLPSGARLRRLLTPTDARAAAGVHTSRRRAEGTELAELRPWQPGDHLRSVNWRASARHGQLFSTARHPDRSADLVLFLDTFADGEAGGSVGGSVGPALEQAVRIAWTVAGPHVAAHDRVGIVGMGGYLRWLPPVGGPRAPYALLDALLRSQSDRAEVDRPVRLVPRSAIPPGALVVAVTPLHEQRFVTALVELRGAGHDVRAVVLDVDAALPYPTDAGAQAALRLWRMERERRASWLTDHGVTVVQGGSGSDAGTALGALVTTGRR